jgi:CDP-glucose 4,6-dehydratase
MGPGRSSLEGLELIMTGTASFWQDRPVLVTGAAGLQGSWLVKRLLNHQADVVTIVRDWVPQSELVRAGWMDQIRVVRGDIRDQALVERVLGEYEISSAFHLAAQTIVPIANRNPISTFESNIQGTWVLLEAARRSPKIQGIVLASSDKAYGEQKSLPYQEELPLTGRHPYDVSKSCADLIAQAYAATYQLPVAIARCGNLYGGGDLNWNRIVPGTIRSLIRGEAPIIRSDGTMTRDYFYVEDGAAAYLTLGEKIASDPSLAGEAFNFSNEQPLSVTQIAEQIIQTMGRSTLKPVIQNEASNEILHQYLDASKAKKSLNWKPVYSLEKGLERTIGWYESYFNELSD